MEPVSTARTCPAAGVQSVALRSTVIRPGSSRETCSSNITAVPSGATSYSLSMALPSPLAVREVCGVPVTRTFRAVGLDHTKKLGVTSPAFWSFAGPLASPWGAGWSVAGASSMSHRPDGCACRGAGAAEMPGAWRAEAPPSSM